MDQQYNQEKFRRMVQYFAFKGKDDETLSVTKLNKLLFYADFAAYRELGLSISGVQYEHWAEGPVPHDMHNERSEMQREHRIQMEKVAYSGYAQERVWSRREPPLLLFSPAEIAIMDRIFERFAGMSAKDVSNLSHEEPGYRLTDMHEPIPYSTAWLAPTKLTPERARRARELATKHGLLG